MTYRYLTPALYTLQRLARKAGRRLPKYRPALYIHKDIRLTTTLLLVRLILRHLTLASAPQLLLFAFILLPRTSPALHFVPDLKARLYYTAAYPRLNTPR